MKLLITTDNFLPQWDGIARFLNEMIPRLKGFDITVVAPDYGKLNAKGFTLVQLPLSKKAFGSYVPAKYNYKLVEQEVKKADLVFNQTIGPVGTAGIRAAKRNSVPCVTFTHSLEWELFPRQIKNTFLKRLAIVFTKRLVKHLYNKCNALITPSAITAEQLSWHGILTTKRVAQLGVDTGKFKPGSKKAAREKLGLSQDAYIIGYHGRISNEKNLPTLLRAFVRVNIPNKQLLIAGDGDENIKRKFKRKDITITGMQADVVPYLQAMDVYVLPSFTETTSLSVLEAMATGIPVISSKVGFVAGYIRHAKNGFFFKVHNTHDLVKKLEHVNGMSTDELISLKAAARATIEKDFNWDSTARKIRKYLKEFMRTEKQGRAGTESTK